MRSTFKLSVLSAFSALLFAACSPATEEAKPMDMDKARADIQAMEDAFAAGEKAKDAAAVAAYYIQMPFRITATRNLFQEKRQSQKVLQNA